MHILIIDDEPLARSRLRHLLTDCSAQGEHWTMSEAASASQALPLLSGPLPVDIVLLDIQMPGANGMSFAFTLQQLPAPPAIIFVTAHSHYAAQAFDVQACDYLTKPVRLERLQQALAKAKKQRPPSDPGPQLAIAPGGPRWPWAQVVYIKAELKMLTVHTTAGCHVLEGSLVDLEQRYPEHVLRIHRSCLVNPAFLQRLEFAEPGGWYLRLHGIAQPLPVSRRQVAVVRKTLTICKK